MTKAKDGSRRDFLKGASLAGAASLLATQRSSAAHSSPDDQNAEPIHAKNLIFLVADGMGTGTLSLAHHWKQSNEGSVLNWMQLYGRPDVVTALQETASASSPVTDSAAAASAWGSGKRVNNRSINIGTDGVPQTPLMTYVKKAGKATGLVSTCRITHATPAGFAANSADRDDEDKIADQYLERGIDVILGGGRRHFDRQGKGQDGKNLLSAFESKGYATALNKESLFAAKGSPKLLGLFSDSHIPYAIDRKFDKSLEAIPSLAEMFQAALKSLESAPNGFVLQVEA
ncbi:MAG: alkaline phosphatase, partial [Verrucomicrobiota bacterium]